MNRRRLGLFIMIDALGFRALADLDFLSEFEYRVGLRTNLGFSCACHPTILSGRPPQDTGHGAMFMLADGPTPLDAARRYAWLPSIISENHRIRARIHAQVSESVDGRRQVNVFARKTYRLDRAVKPLLKTQYGIDCDQDYAELDARD